jgi:uncharacterized protein YbjT (DUF2867 family)
MRIAVVGGTGTAGRHVVRAAGNAGVETVVVSRRTGVDVRTGEGLEKALEGVEVIIDAADAGTIDRSKATSFFTEATGHLQSVGAVQGVSRLVTLSIVGLERVPAFGYYQAKLAQEAAAVAGPLPTTIVRTTQFHEFATQFLSRGRVGPLALVPHMKIQPIAARTVGEALLEAAVSPSRRQTLEIAGPEVRDLVAMARAIARQQRMRTLVVPLRVPGRAGRAMRSGGQLPLPDVRAVGPRFEEWLQGEDLAAAFP